MTTLTPEAYELLSDSEKAKYEKVDHPKKSVSGAIYYLVSYNLKIYDANQVEAIIKKLLERAADSSKAYFDFVECEEKVDKQSILTTPYEDLI